MISKMRNALARALMFLAARLIDGKDAGITVRHLPPTEAS